jgi:hypothetical protein
MTIAAVVIMYAAFLIVGWLAARKVKDGGAAEPLFGVPPLLSYARIAARLVHGGPASWYAPGGSLLFPFRPVAALAGLVLLPVVSRPEPAP